jgi:hypothetical protein
MCFTTLARTISHNINVEASYKRYIFLKWMENYLVTYVAHLHMANLCAYLLKAINTHT